MKIRVLGWEYKDIRRMKELEVNLEKSKQTVYPNTLIMMSNGAGKTTTLHLIRAVFSGNAVNWKEREVRSFRPVGSEAAEGQFVLRMMFGTDIFYYVLHLDYEEGRAWYETSSAITGGYEKGRHLPYALRGVFDYEEFVSRFVFDGEQARKTLNSGSNEAEDAITYLYQLNRLDNLKNDIDELVQEMQSRSYGGATARSIKVFQGKEEKRKRIYEDLLNKQTYIQRELETMKENYHKYQKKYQNILAQDKRLKEEQTQLLQEQKSQQEEIRRAVAGVLESIRKPYNLHPDIDMSLKALVKNMQTLKLPKATAKEFFNELASGKECICGHCIGKKERENILRKAQEYLGEDSLVVVNSIKNRLKEYEKGNSCSQLTAYLKESMEKEDEIKAAISHLTVRLVENGHEEAMDIEKTMQGSEKEIQVRSSLIHQMTTRDYNSNPGLNSDNNIPKALEAYEEAKDNYLKASGTYRFTKKAERMKAYISNVKNNALKKLKQYMVEETNSKISHLIENDRIVIKKIDGYLVLDGKDGASEGQTLAVAYAYIGTLFEHSRFEFPFIVDSPAAPMDLSVRREVAKILPQLFSQIIIFVTSGEKSDFAERFFKRDDVYYLTLKGKKDQPLEACEGREAFEQYQEEGEA